MITLDSPVEMSTEHQEDTMNAKGNLITQQINDWLAHANWSMKHESEGHRYRMRKEWNIKIC